MSWDRHDSDLRRAADEIIVRVLHDDVDDLAERLVEVCAQIDAMLTIELDEQLVKTINGESYETRHCAADFDRAFEAGADEPDDVAGEA